MNWLLALGLMAQTAPESRPVIKLDDAFLQGAYKRPAMIELESAELNEKVQRLALQSLIQLEKELLAPTPRPQKAK